MKASTTFSVTFFPRKGRTASTKYLLYARITVNSQRVEFSLKRKVEIASWDKARGRAKGNTSSSKILNAKLQNTRAQIVEAYDSLLKDKKLITAESIKSRFLNQDSTGATLIQAFRYHENHCFVDLAPGTQSHYNTAEKHVVRFMKSKYKVNDMFLSELSYSFLTKYDHFLRNYKPKKKGERKLANNAVVKTIQRLRKVIKLAVKLEWLDKDPFISYQPKLTKTKRKYLSADQLKSIEEKVINIDRLSYIRDLFVFSCYSAFAYIDAINFTPNEIVLGIDGEKWIYTNRGKNDNPVRIPLLPKAKAMIDKYKNDPRSVQNGTVFPKISNQKLNAYLKEIATICGIESNLTFHVARHTFATTIALSNGLPIETLSKILGHSKITTTQIYAKVIEQKVSSDMKALKNSLSVVQKEKSSAPNSKTS